MFRRFPNRPQSTLSLEKGLVRESGRLSRLVLGERIIISRSQCHFETMQAPPGRQSLQGYEAVKLSARARTPISNPAFYFDWGDTLVGIWSWPSDLIQSIEDFEGQLFPETVLQVPMTGGERVVETLDGFEGQVWRDSCLVASRWWPVPPSATEWMSFLRAARLQPASASAPLPQSVPLQNAPNKKRPYPALIDQLRSTGWRDIAAVALLVFVIPALYLGGQWAQLTLALSAAQEELEQLSQETAEISAARTRAQAASSELAAYANVLNRRHPAAVLASVSEDVNRLSLRLDASDFSEDQLTLVIQAGPGFLPEELVRVMENSPLMNSVSVEPGRGAGEWVLSARLEEEQ